MSDRRGAVLVRIAFAAVVLSLPLMFVVKDLSGETYPGLYQPTFGNPPAKGTVVGSLEPQLTVLDGAGRWHRVDTSRLDVGGGAWPDMPARITKAALGRPDDLRTPAGRRWLTKRFTELGIRQPVSMRVRWYATRHDVRTPRVAIHLRTLRTYDVRLDGRP